MAKQIQSENVKGTTKSSRIKALQTKQDSWLAEKGLSFDQVFSVETIKFGALQAKKWQTEFAKAIDTKKIVKALVANGAPQEFAEMQVRGIVESINPNAGLNEAIREFAAKKHGIPADFWDTTGNSSATPANVETVDVV